MMIKMLKKFAPKTYRKLRNRYIKRMLMKAVYPMTMLTLGVVVWCLVLWNIGV